MGQPNPWITLRHTDGHSTVLWRLLIPHIPSTHLGIWACGSTWRSHTGKRGSSAPHQRITQPTSWPHVASPTWSSTEQVARPATKRFHVSDWTALEACCRPWTWWCNDATALAGYATMTMMIPPHRLLCGPCNNRRCLPTTTGVEDDEVRLRGSVDKPYARLRLPVTDRRADVPPHLVSTANKIPRL